jgi:uncharacterized membrane protein YgdD (TMEM256/DUF423 family)
MGGRFWTACGAVLAALAVAAGALGAHLLKEVLQLPERELATYEVAVRYQMVHALGLILVGLLAARGPSRLLSAGGWALLLGTVLFSGGIYAWLATGVQGFVHVVPVGGTIWIVGWLLIGASALVPPAEPR